MIDIFVFFDVFTILLVTLLGTWKIILNKKMYNKKPKTNFVKKNNHGSGQNFCAFSRINTIKNKWKVML